MQEIVINFTPTGMLPSKADTPFVPITTDEIVHDVREAWEIGISMVHIHARDKDTGLPSHKKEDYAPIIAGIRSFSKDLIICVSTSGRMCPEYEKRADVLSLENDLKPDMASLTLSSLNFNQQASINEPSTIMRLLEEMNRRNIKPELEAFDLGMINYAKYLIKKGLLDPPYYFNLILGNIACAQANPLHLGMMIQELPEPYVCSVGGIGGSQLTLNSAAIAFGLGVRVGIEDNTWYDEKRTCLAKNIDLIKRIHTIISANNKMLMKSKNLRKLLCLNDAHTNQH
jgi:uncharacterized protein (DUF849 family)